MVSERLAALGPELAAGDARDYPDMTNVVRELFDVMVAKGAAGGFVVTSGIFTSDAPSLANGRSIELIDGPALAAMIESACAARKVSPPVERPCVTRSPSPPVVHTTPAAEPTCPCCGSAMARRTAKRGANAGSVFWVCSTFPPKCRGVRAGDWRIDTAQ